MTIHDNEDNYGRYVCLIFIVLSLTDLFKLNFSVYCVNKHSGNALDYQSNVWTQKLFFFSKEKRLYNIKPIRYVVETLLIL